MSSGKLCPDIDFHHPEAGAECARKGLALVRNLKNRRNPGPGTITRMTRRLASHAVDNDSHGFSDDRR